MPPTVSVIITTYNRPDLISRALESVLSQTYEDLECIVVDDCSPENKSREIIKSFDDSRLSYLRHKENKGLAAARNTGIEHSDGEFVAFLDDDDQWYKNKLAKQISLFKNLGPDYGLVYCWMNICDDDGNLIEKYCPKHSGDIFPKALEGQPIGAGSTLLVRRSIAEEVEGFDESLPRGIDGDFIRRVCYDYKVDYVPELLVQYNVDHGHDRITTEDREGIQNALLGHMSKIEKFDSELEKYPDSAAHIYADISNHYARLGKLSLSLKYYKKAICLKPASVEIHRRWAGGLKNNLVDTH
jgi:glycosyltransferase involved in cell wall biosynthesis